MADESPVADEVLSLNTPTTWRAPLRLRAQQAVPPDAGVAPLRSLGPPQENGSVGRQIPEWESTHV